VLRVPNAALRFRPAEQTAERRGPAVWVQSEGQLHPIRVRPGITDGTMTAIVEGELAENAQVITGQVVSGAEAAAQTTRSPFMPQRPAGNRQNRQAAPGGAR